MNTGDTRLFARVGRTYAFCAHCGNQHYLVAHTLSMLDKVAYAGQCWICGYSTSTWVDKVILQRGRGKISSA